MRGTMLLRSALLVGAAASSAPPALTCPAGSDGVGTASFYGCVKGGRLTMLGGLSAAAGAPVYFDVAAGSTIAGCTEVAGTLQVSQLGTAGGQGGRGGLAGGVVATRQLTCGPDPTWHPGKSFTATVRDTFYASAASPVGQAHSLSWNVSFSSTSPEMWTAPLDSGFNAQDVTSPMVWVGGPSSSKAALSNLSSPLDPLQFGQCDGARGGRCKYWYGGGLTDLQFHQGLVTKNQQGKELVDAPSMALPIAILLGRSASPSPRVPAQPVGLTFAQSALDHPVSMTLTTAQVGGSPPPPPGHCNDKPQPCPGHKGVTFCPNDPTAGQCSAPMPHKPCPRCPHGPPPPPPPAAPTSPGGSFRFSRQYHRLGGGAAPVTFSQSLLLHAVRHSSWTAILDRSSSPLVPCCRLTALSRLGNCPGETPHKQDCFRPALQWYDRTYPEVMRVNPHIDRDLVDGWCANGCRLSSLFAAAFPWASLLPAFLCGPTPRGPHGGHLLVGLLLASARPRSTTAATASRPRP